MENKKYLNYVLGSLVLFLLVSTFSIYSFASSYSRVVDNQNYRTLTVSAQEKIMVVPDVAVISFGFLNSGDNVAELQKINNDRQKNVLDKIEKLNVDALEINTDTYNISPKYEITDSGDNGKIVGYLLGQYTTLKFKDFAKIEEVLSILGESGVDDIRNVVFDVEDIEKLEAKARAKAINKAKMKAKIIANGTDIKIGKISSVYMQPISTSFRDYPLFAMDGDVRQSEKLMSSTPQEMFGIMVDNEYEKGEFDAAIFAGLRDMEFEELDNDLLNNSYLNIGSKEITVKVEVNYFLD